MFQSNSKVTHLTDSTLSAWEGIDGNLYSTIVGSKNTLKIPKCGLMIVYAPWCGHCQKVSGEWEKLARESSKYDVYALDGDEHSELRETLGVKSFPSFFKIKNGKLDKYEPTNRDLPTFKKDLKDLCKTKKKKLSKKPLKARGKRSKKRLRRSRR